MLEQLIPLLGKSIESEEIKNIFTEWRTQFPKRTYCTANEPNLKVKLEKDCIRLYFGRGANSKFLKPIPAHWQGGYIGMFYMIEFTKKSRGGIPFDITHGMTAQEISAIMGEPQIAEFMGKITTWKKNTSDNHGLMVCDTEDLNGNSTRAITLSYIYEPDLYSDEDYQKAGF